MYNTSDSSDDVGKTTKVIRFGQTSHGIKEILIELNVFIK